MTMGKAKSLFSLSAIGFFILGTVGTLWALNADYNRPNPLLDYVPQEIGMYDARYDELTEMDCRGCHGDSLTDRHHYSPSGLDHQCDHCHDMISEPPGVVVIHDCTTNGCHSWDDVLGSNGWHHGTDLSAPENCVVCHDPNLVVPIAPFLPFAQYPPSVVTPTPFSCENCHWAQAVVDSGWAEGDPPPPEADAGHPSTYDHYDPWGNPMGYHEYGRPILGNFDTHHMGFKTSFGAQCGSCHADDPNAQGWDPYNSELIRYCETCHDHPTLHTVHLTGDQNAWEAIGFHAGGGGPEPPSYRTFPVQEACWECHEGFPEPSGRSCSPAIRMNPQGITPSAGPATFLVELTGECFGDTHGEGQAVQLKNRVDGGAWIDMPIDSWSHDRVVFDVPCLTLTPGNYWVRVHNEDSLPSNPNSNQVVFTFTGDG